MAYHIMFYNHEEYDYHDYDEETAFDEDYSSSDTYHRESTFPAGSGAGGSTFEAYATEWDDHDIAADNEKKSILLWKLNPLRRTPVQ